MTAFSVAFRLRAVRERSNLSQTDLASRANVSRNTVSNLENTNDAKLSTLIALSAALGVPAHTWLLPDRDWFEWFCSEFSAGACAPRRLPPVGAAERWGDGIKQGSMGARSVG